ncbi:MAG: hypothetical protein O7B27_01630 [Gammaproteobacteria bacterium]|nr:hypothetical protein [Gammaproteobacteria bacterium]
MKGFIGIYLKKCLVPQFSERVFALAAIDEQFGTWDVRLVSQCQQAQPMDLGGRLCIVRRQRRDGGYRVRRDSGMRVGRHVT